MHVHNKRPVWPGASLTVPAPDFLAVPHTRRPGARHGFRSSAPEAAFQRQLLARCAPGWCRPPGGGGRRRNAPAAFRTTGRIEDAMTHEPVAGVGGIGHEPGPGAAEAEAVAPAVHVLHQPLATDACELSR